MEVLVRQSNRRWWQSATTALLAGRDVAHPESSYDSIGWTRVIVILNDVPPPVLLTFRICVPDSEFAPGGRPLGLVLGIIHVYRTIVMKPR